jgi:anti-sigma regulatory factor (Ser/Thr protein kinase)
LLASVRTPAYRDSVSSPRDAVLPHDHDVTFYDADRELIDELTEFVTDGLALGETVVLVATAEHHSALALSLEAAGCRIDEALARGQYFPADAAATMATFLRGDRPDEDLFFQSVGALVAEAAASNRPLRVFGEMVALLWADGLVPAALELEALWNRLGRVQRFSLLCAYPTSSLSEPADLSSVHSVCRLHSEVLPPACYDAEEPAFLAPAGELASQVFVPTLPAVRAVRRLVTDTLRAWGEEALIPDATLLVSEMATNAVRHASSPFRASVTRSDGAVRIAVEDLGTNEPQLRPADPDRLGGRGVALVDAVSLTWGWDPAPGGKVVWCELPMTSGRLAG